MAGITPGGARRTWKNALLARGRKADGKRYREEDLRDEPTGISRAQAYLVIALLAVLVLLFIWWYAK
jgi:hypothetical protein